MKFSTVDLGLERGSQRGRQGKQQLRHNVQDELHMYMEEGGQAQQPHLQRPGRKEDGLAQSTARNRARPQGNVRSGELYLQGTTLKKE